MKRIVYTTEISFYVDEDGTLRQVDIENGKITECHQVGDSQAVVKASESQIKSCLAAFNEITEFCSDELGEPLDQPMNPIYL